MQQEPNPEPIGLRNTVDPHITQQELDNLHTELQKCNMWMEQWKARALRAEEVLDRVTNDRNNKWHKILDRAILMSLDDDGDIAAERLVVSANSLFVEELVEEVKENIYSGTDNPED